MRARWGRGGAGVALVVVLAATLGPPVAGWLGGSPAAARPPTRTGLPSSPDPASPDPGSAGADAGAPPGDVALTPPPDQFDGPAPPPAPAPRALDTAPPPVKQGGTWAVVIGIDDYPGSAHDLRSAGADATDVDAALAAYGVPADHRLVLRDRQATAGRIRAAADWMVARAGPQATAVFFYAGHVRKLARTREALVGADGGLVADQDLAGHLAGLEAHQAWFALAACYGGGFTELLGPGRVLTAAADADHVAYENEGFGRSYLVEYMVRRAMLGRAAPETVQQSFAWAATAIGRDYPNRQPVQVDRAGGPVRLGELAPPPAPAPPPASPAPSSSPPPPAPAAPPASPPPTDGCARLTLGVVSCS